MSFFQFINLFLVLSLFLLFGKFLWDYYFMVFFQPQEWKFAKKSRTIDKKVLKLERKYKDKVRFFTWWLQVERLKRDKIEGAFAELGVYKGESAKVLHSMDSDRMFYLFDSFHGFSQSDLNLETGEASTYSTDNFGDTNLELVKRYIDGNDKIVFLPGYFPQTVGPIVNERFAMVNIDADLYTPTKSGLEFFYPRLVEGGVIFIHDYNHKWEGLMKAVDEFCKEIPEVPCLISDTEGTILLIKSKKK